MPMYLKLNGQSVSWRICRFMLVLIACTILVVFGESTSKGKTERIPSKTTTRIMPTKEAQHHSAPEGGLQAGSPWPKCYANNFNSAQVNKVQTIHSAKGILRWKFNVGSVIETSPVIGSDGTIYVSTGNGNLDAIRPDGTLKWNDNNLGKADALTAPAIGSDGTIYVGSSEPGRLYAIRPDGIMKWIVDVNTPTTPAIAGDTIYVVSKNLCTLYAFRSDDMRKWELQFDCHYRLSYSPSIGPGGTIYTGDGVSHLLAIRPDSSEKWSTYLSLGSAQCAIGSDGTIYASALDDSTLYALNENGKLKWKNYFFGQVAIGSDGTIYVVSTVDTLDAIRPDGKLKWSYHLEEGSNSNPAIGSDGTIYVVSESIFHNSLYAIRPDGKLKWKYFLGHKKYSFFSISEYSPVIGSDGTIYVGSADGNLYAIK